MRAKYLIRLGVAAIATVATFGHPEGAAAVPSSPPAGQSSNSSQQPGQYIPAPGTGSCDFIAPWEQIYVQCLSRWMPNQNQLALLAEIARIKAQIAALVELGRTATPALRESYLRQVTELQSQLAPLVQAAMNSVSGGVPPHCTALWNACCTGGRLLIAAHNSYP